MFTTKSPTTNESVLRTSNVPADQRWASLKHDLHRRLIQAVDHVALRHLNESQFRSALRMGAEELCRSRAELLSSTDRNRMIDEVVNETLGLGPLEKVLQDPTVSDILINGAKTVFVERNGVLEQAPIAFHDDEHLLSTIQKIVSKAGRRIDESSPMVDARLPDGSRVNVIIRPLAVDGALVSIRRFRADAVTYEAMLANGTLTREMFEFLAGCVKARANILISGGTGSGKTTLLNVLSGYIPAHERIVTIEDAAELQLHQPHVARLETRPPNVEGSGEFTARDLLKNALRMRPDRIVVGECRGGEAFDMLQAMNTGHEGGLTTLHANSARDALTRMQMLVALADVELSPQLVARQIASTMHIVVQVGRLAGGVRRAVQIAEVKGVKESEVVVEDLFRFESEGEDSSGKAIGRFVRTNVSSRFEPSRASQSRMES